MFHILLARDLHSADNAESSWFVGYQAEAVPLFNDTHNAAPSMLP